RVVFGPAETTGMHGAALRANQTRVTVDAELDGRHVWMIADTGVLRTIVYERGPESILENYRVQGRIVAQSMGGLVENRVVTVLQLRLGDQDLDRQVVFVAPPAGNNLNDVAGYLGPASLNARQIVFDFKSNELRWK
ncbi:MAG: aspartyl protease family protein, partial [Candidatus Acidiferrum sp.]